MCVCDYGSFALALVLLTVTLYYLTLYKLQEEVCFGVWEGVRESRRCGGCHAAAGVSWHASAAALQPIQVSVQPVPTTRCDGPFPEHRLMPHCLNRSPRAIPSITTHHSPLVAPQAFFLMLPDWQLYNFRVTVILAIVGQCVGIVYTIFMQVRSTVRCCAVQSYGAVVECKVAVPCSSACRSRKSRKSLVPYTRSAVPDQPPCLATRFA